MAAEVVSRGLGSACADGTCPAGCSHLMWACSFCSCEGGWGTERERLDGLAEAHDCPADAPGSGQVTGFSLDLRGGVELQGLAVAGYDRPLLGLRSGGVFVAVAEFISVADLEHLRGVLQGRVFVIEENGGGDA